MNVAGEVLHLPGGGQARIQLRGGDTGGAFTLITDVQRPGWELGPHRHANESETMHIVAGASWVEVDGERRELRAGDTAHVPVGALHSGGTPGDEPMRRVLVLAPAGIEEFFEALAALDDPSKMLALAADYGWTFGA